MIVKWVRLEIGAQNQIIGQFVSVSKDKTMKLWDTRQTNKPVHSEKSKETRIQDLVACKFDQSGHQ
jgi:hypothetical protein